MPVASTSRETLEDQVTALQSAQAVLYPTTLPQSDRNGQVNSACTWHRPVPWREEEEEKDPAGTDPVSPASAGWSGSEAEPEVVHLLHVLVEEYLPWPAKIEAARMILDARLAASPTNDAQAVRKIFYLSLLSTTCSAVTGLLRTSGLLSPGPTNHLDSEGVLPVASPSSAHNYISQCVAVLCGLIPRLIFELESSRSRDATGGSRSVCAQIFRVFVFKQRNALVEIEKYIAQRSEATVAGANAAEEDAMLDWLDHNPSTPKAPIHCGLFRTLLELQLVDAVDCEGTAAVSFSSMEPSLLAEAGAKDQVQSLVASKLQGSAEEVEAFLGSAVTDCTSHLPLSECLTQSVASASQALDLEPICRVAKACLKTPPLVDIWLLYSDPMDILVPVGLLLDKPDVAESADEPVILRNIVLFAQWLLQRIVIVQGHRTLETLARHCNFLPRFMNASAALPSLAQLQPNERDLVGRWVHALFDSEGISDDLMRDSSPQILMRLAPLLFSQSIEACNAGVIDLETLRGGLDYFAQDLLCFALPAGLSWVATDVQRRSIRHAPSDSIPGRNTSATAGISGGLEFSTHFEVLKHFLLADNADETVAQLVAPVVKQALEEATRPQMSMLPVMDLEALAARVDAALRHLPMPRRSEAWTAPAFGTSLPNLPARMLQTHQALLCGLARSDKTITPLAEHFFLSLNAFPNDASLRKSLAALVSMNHVRHLSSYSLPKGDSGEFDLLLRLLRRFVPDHAGCAAWNEQTVLLPSSAHTTTILLSLDLLAAGRGHAHAHGYEPHTPMDIIRSHPSAPSTVETAHQTGSILSLIFAHAARTRGFANACAPALAALLGRTTNEALASSSSEETEPSLQDWYKALREPLEAVFPSLKRWRELRSAVPCEMQSAHDASCTS